MSYRTFLSPRARRAITTTTAALQYRAQKLGSGEVLWAVNWDHRGKKIMKSDLAICFHQMKFGWWFGTCFPSIGNNHPNWLSYFSEGLKPPTRHWKVQQTCPKQSAIRWFFFVGKSEKLWWIMMNAIHTPKIPYAKCIIYIPCVEKLLTRNIANLNHDIFFEHNLALLEKGKQEWSRLGTAVVKQSQGNPWAACIFMCVLNLRVPPNLMVCFSMLSFFPMNSNCCNFGYPTISKNPKK